MRSSSHGPEPQPDPLKPGCDLWDQPLGQTLPPEVKPAPESVTGLWASADEPPLGAAPPGPLTFVAEPPPPGDMCPALVRAICKFPPPPEAEATMRSKPDVSTSRGR